MNGSRLAFGPRSAPLHALHANAIFKDNPILRQPTSQRSFWLETCGDGLTPRPLLTCSIDLDVAILGGGYTGLWTAY